MYKLILSRCYLYNRAVSNIQCPEFSHFTRIQFEFSRQKPCSSNETFLVIFKRHEKLKHHCLTDFLKSYHFLTLARFSRIVTYLAKRDAIHIHSHVQALHVLPGEPRFDKVLHKEERVIGLRASCSSSLLTFPVVA